MSEVTQNSQQQQNNNKPTYIYGIFGFELPQCSQNYFKEYLGFQYEFK